MHMKIRLFVIQYIDMICRLSREPKLLLFRFESGVETMKGRQRRRGVRDMLVRSGRVVWLFPKHQATDTLALATLVLLVPFSMSRSTRLDRQFTSLAVRTAYQP